MWLKVIVGNACQLGFSIILHVNSHSGKFLLCDTASLVKNFLNSIHVSFSELLKNALIAKMAQNHITKL